MRRRSKAIGETAVPMVGGLALLAAALGGCEGSRPRAPLSVRGGALSSTVSTASLSLQVWSNSCGANQALDRRGGQGRIGRGLPAVRDAPGPRADVRPRAVDVRAPAVTHRRSSSAG
jgi:hypothetical protein